MRTIRVIIFVLGVAVVLCGSTAKAGLLNGGFETGDLTGWTATGTVQAVTDEYPRDFMGLSQAPYTLHPVYGSPWWLPTEGDHFASLWSTDSMGTDASTLEQSFTAPAGYRLEFDYFFDFGSDWMDPDTATATLTGPGGPVTLFEHNTFGELGDDENIDWTHVLVPLATAGDYTLEFKVTDSWGVFESIMGVDDVSVVPLPSALVLGSLGLGVASSLVGRFQRRRTRQ